MNTEKIEKLKKSLSNSKIPADLKPKIEAEIKRLEDLDAKNSPEPKEEEKPVAKTRKPRTTKPVAKKTTARKPSETSKPKRTAMSVAKEIRKDGESWKDAMARASKVMKEKTHTATKDVESELEKLTKLVRSKKELKGQLGQTNLLRDAKRKAKPMGKRISKDGNVYYENRANRTDKGTYGKYHLAEGGSVDNSIIDELWRGYASAILFTETDMDSGEPLDSEFSIYDFNKESEANSKKMLSQYYSKYKDAIEESELDLETVGMDIWYTQSGQGAGFFDHSLDQEVEDKLTKGAEEFGKFPSTETYRGKVIIRGGKSYAEGGGVGYSKKERVIDYYYNNDVFDDYETYGLSEDDLNDENKIVKAIIKYHDLDDPKMVKERFNNLGLDEYASGGEISSKQLDLGYQYSFNKDEDNVGSLYKEAGVYSVIGFENGKHFSESFEKFSDAKKFYLDKKGKVKFADGGGIPNNYEGKTPEEVWDMWTEKQKQHFLVDHFNHFIVEEFKGKNLIDISRLEYKKLPLRVRLELDFHVNKGQYAKGGGIRRKNGQTYDYGRVWTKDHNEFDKGSDHEVEYRRKRFELGGNVVTDLAGHTGGSLGTGDPSMLDGVSGTAYTGLVGETGAMSSGEMFMDGGTLPEGVSQSYMITESLGNPAQHFAKGGGVEGDRYDGKTEKIVEELKNLKGGLDNKAPYVYQRDGFIYVSAEEGDNYADYDNYLFIDEKLEDFADKYDTYWDWENAGAIVLMPLSDEDEYANGGGVNNNKILKEEKMEKQKLKDGDNVLVIGRRWFDRVNGNTYHTAEVEVNGKFVGKSPMTYGYDEQYLQTSKEILLEHYDFPTGMTERSPMWQLRDYGVTLTKTVTDGLKRDLAKGGGFSEHNGRKYDIGRNWTKDHNEFDKEADHEVEYRRKKSFFADGGEFMTDPTFGNFQNQVFAKGGKVSPFKNMMETNTITEKEINLIKLRLNNDKVDEETQEAIDYIWEEMPQLTPDQNKKGIEYLRNLWKSPTGKERANNPFGYREQEALETFEGFALRGFYDAGNRYRKFYVPLYVVFGEDTSFEYAFYNGEVNILG
jgi:hypothetical protein